MLHGERVILRARRREDLPRLAQFNNDLEVELAGGGDPPLPQSLDRLEAEFNQRISNGGRDGTEFAIEAEGVIIGICALFNPDPVAHTRELGIAIGDKAYGGRGYGREALTLLLDYAFRHHHVHKVWLRVQGRNARAQRAYLAIGFVEKGRQKQQVWNNGSYDDLVYMGLLRSAWEKPGAA